MPVRLKLGTCRMGLDETDEGFIFGALQDINLALGVSDCQGNPDPPFVAKTYTGAVLFHQPSGPTNSRFAHFDP